MFEKEEAAFRQFIAALQLAKLYSTTHARFDKMLDLVMDAMKLAMRDREEMTFGIVGDELAFEKEVLFELSRSLRIMIAYLKDRKVERICFNKNLQKDDLRKTIDFLMMGKDAVVKEPQEYLNSAGVRGISMGKLHASAGVSNDELLAKAQKAVDFLSFYNDSLDNVSSTIDHVLNNEEADLMNLRFGMSSIMDNLVARSQELLKLTTVKRYDMTTFVHIFNVAIIAMYFSAKLGLPKETVLDIGTAALFHDIGKLYISRRIIRKTDKLTDEEFNAIRSHSTTGAEILLKYVSSIGILPAVVCFEHHLKYDVSGYPKTRFPRRPHLSSLIVTICDVYDALFQRRSYKASYAPTVVYEIMCKEKGKAFDPGLLERFFSVFGVWPIGTLVELTDGRIGVVRDENPDAIYLPKVEVLFPKSRREFIDLKVAAGDLKIKRHLDPVTDGKPYAALV